MSRRRSKRGTDHTGRSKGEGRFVQLTFFLLQSPAYMSLSPNARALLVGAATLFNGANNGNLAIPVRKAAELMGVRNLRTASLAINELQDRRFLVKTAAHVFRRHGGGRASEYRLSWQPTSDAPAGHEYRLWRRDEGKFYRGTDGIQSADDPYTDPANSASEIRDTVGHRHTATLQKAELSDNDRYTHIIYHGEDAERAELADCEFVRKEACEFKASVGRGGQRHLARLAGVGEAKLSRFLSPNGRGRTLPRHDLNRSVTRSRGPAG